MKKIIICLILIVSIWYIQGIHYSMNTVVITDSNRKPVHVKQLSIWHNQHKLYVKNYTK